MADNTVLNSGTGGDTIATDDIGGVKYPRSKIVLGANGTNDGDVSSSNPMPVVGNGTFVVQVNGSLLTVVTDFASAFGDCVGAADTESYSDGYGTVVAGVVRKDVSTALSDTDGDFTVLQVDSNGALRVSLPTVNQPLADDADFTPTSTTGQLIFGVYESSPTSVTDGDIGAVGITQTRAMKVSSAQSGTWTVTGAGGSFPVTDSGGSLTVDNNGTFAVQSVCTNTGTFAVQAAQSGSWTVSGTGTAGSAASGVMTVQGVASMTPVQVSQATASNLNATVVGTGTFSVQVSSLPASTNTLEVVGDVAHDAAIAGNPVTIGGVASAAAPSDVSADQDAVRVWCLRNGSPVVNLAAGGTLITATSSSINANITNASLTVASHAVTVASGGIASGAIASGAIASGAVASGAFASGALASGSIASGAIADMIVDDAAFTPATSRVMMAGFQADESSTDSVNEGDAGAVRMTLDRKLITTIQPHTAGGCSMFRSIDIDESEEEIKASAGQVYGIHCMNLTNALLYLKFYNLTAGNCTVGTSTPVLTFPVPGNNDTDGAGFTFNLPQGIAFDTAISVAATTGVADADMGAPAANACVVNVFYM